MPPHDPNRRDLLKLGLLGAPMLATRCIETPLASTIASDGRLRARPIEHVRSSATASVMEPTPHPQPLGLGRGRDGFFYVPSRPNAAPAPLLLYLHGATGSGGRAIERFVEIANHTGIVVVAPDSRSRTWGMVSGDEEADLAFIDAALQKLFDRYPIDPHRIGIAGFSDGATAALSVGLVNGDLFSGIAAFSPGFLHLSSRPKGMPRIFISHGVEDEILPIERCGRKIAGQLRQAGYTVEYREFDGDHTVPPEIRDAGLRWLLEEPQ